MKNYGKIIKYNGVYGEIMGNDGSKYSLLDKDIIGDKNCLENELVEFEPESFKTPEVEINVARLVRVLKKDIPKNKK